MPLKWALYQWDHMYKFFAPKDGMTMNQLQKAHHALNEIDSMLQTSDSGGKPRVGAPAALFSHIDPQRLLTNIRVLTELGEALTPEVYKPILEAIDEGLGKLKVGGQAPQ